MGITKTGTGTWTIRGNNNHTGTNRVYAGTLSLQSSAALGSTAAGVVTQEGVTIEVTGGTALNKGTVWTLLSAGGASSLKSSAGTNSIACGGVTMSSTLPIDVSSGASLEIKNTGAMSGGSMGITKTGAGELILSSSANTFTGPVTVNEGTLTVQSIANGGANSSLGAGSGALSTVRIVGTLKNTGSGGQSNRVVEFDSTRPTINSSGTNLVSLQMISQFPADSERTIVLDGTNAQNNVLNSKIKNISKYVSTGNLSGGITGRYSHTATLLNDGRVLFVGGWKGTDATTYANCEIYNPATGTWSSTGSLLLTPRKQHTATLLDDGRVLVVGGRSTTATLSTCEIYNPISGTWSSAASITGTRRWHTATLLNDGRVLVAGGNASNGDPVATCQLYNPITNTWSAAGSMPVTRDKHAAVKLNDGRVIVISGGLMGAVYTATCNIYNPSTNTWAVTGSISGSRLWPRAVLLDDGDVLMTGGYAASGGASNSCQRFSLSAGTWTTMASSTFTRQEHDMVNLGDGRIFIDGGSANNSSEIYDVDKNQWYLAGTNSSARYGLSATLLQSGDVLVAGGAESILSTDVYTVNHRNVSVEKSGTGKWILSDDDLSYTGTTTITNGTFDLGSTARSLTGGVSITGGTLQNGSATLTSDVTASGGSILCALAGSGKTLDVVGGEVYLYPPAENTYTGGTTVDSAAVLTLKTDANPSTVGSGKVLGTGSTIVDGELRTAAGGDQKGKLRYGGGLTFGTGAKLHIGSAS